MLDPDIREILLETSKLTQDVGRKIGSPKNDVEDLLDLSKALEHISKIVKISRRTQLRRYLET